MWRAGSTGCILINGRCVLINIAAAQDRDDWFGVAWAGDDFVATATGSTRELALANLRRCLPSGVTFRLAETRPRFLTAAVAMLGAIERGQEEARRFTLSPYLSDPLRRILTVAAAIPIGYVTTYGNIAKAAGSEARAVGRVMATNPLYPIVPCHRVVGADMSLVGYGGRQNEEALAAKLGRIQAEARGKTHEREVKVPDGVLIVYPAEWVVDKARADEDRRQSVGRRRAEQEAAERQQLRLF